ncbi:MAG: MFS transporter [Chlamydiota bacterium]|nr:MFS transporter [Chlamydiota bacterium]
MKRNVLPLFTLLFIDNLGATLVYPLLAPLFIGPEAAFLPSPSFHPATLLGLCLALFPLMQMFTSPFMGGASDRCSPKVLLIVSTSLSALGFFLCGWGVDRGHLIVLMGGRALSGIGASNLSILFSVLLGEARKEKEGGEYLRRGAALSGVAFVVGPLIGGKLSDSSLSDTLGPSFPFFFGSVAFLSAAVCLFFWRSRSFLRVGRVSPSSKGKKRLLGIFFLFLLAWCLLFLFIPAFCVKRYSMDSGKIGSLFSLLGVFWVMGSGWVGRWLKTPSWALLGVALLSLFLAFSLPFLIFLGVLGGITLLSGAIWPLSLSKIASKGGVEERGRIMGLCQSVLSLALLAASLLGGQLFPRGPLLFFAASASAWGAFFLGQSLPKVVGPSHEIE